MPPEICPSLFYFWTDEHTKPENEDDIFRPDGFRVLQAEKLTHIKEIITNASEQLQVGAAIFCGDYAAKKTPLTRSQRWLSTFL